MNGDFSDLRCPEPTGKLLARVRTEGKVTDGNLIELHCKTCSRDIKNEEPNVRHVLHRFYLDGTPAETVIVYFDGKSVVYDD